MRLTSHFPKGLDPVHSVARLRLASSLTGQASSDEGAFRRFHVKEPDCPVADIEEEFE